MDLLAVTLALAFICGMAFFGAYLGVCACFYRETATDPETAHKANMKTVPR